MERRVGELALTASVFACLLGAALVGMRLPYVLPERLLTKDTEDFVKLGMGVVATLSALVLGLLVATVKEAFDLKETEIRQFSADLILLDRELVHYGPEANDARDLLRRYASFARAVTWPDEGSEPEELKGWRPLEDVQDRLRALGPRDDVQRWLQARALGISGDLARTHWLLDVQKGRTIRAPLLVTVVGWFTIIFASFGIFAPRNATAITTLVVCSLSIAASILLIVEMDGPFAGFIQISSAPMRKAIADIAH
jgi:hypothetical protein